MRHLGSVWLTRKGKRIRDVIEACRFNWEFLVWREKNNREVARTFKFWFCDAVDGLSHVGGSVRQGFRFVVWFGAGRVGRIHCIWGAGIPRSPCCNLLGWVGVCGIMRNAWRRCRRSDG